MRRVVTDLLICNVRRGDEEDTVDRNDIELGDEPLEVERRPRAGAVVSVRLTAEEAARLQDLAERQRTTTSRLVRHIIGEYLKHGSGHQVAVSPWTGTTTGWGNLEVNYARVGPMVRTDGSVLQPARSVSY